MKILYVTTIGMTMTFFKELVRDLMDQGHTVDIMCNEALFPVPRCYRDWNCRIFHHTCTRSPFSPDNLKAAAQIRDLVREEAYDIVHCHTPIASFCTRIACSGLRRQGLKVIYTAHGFHFYKGAPLLNWLLYYPAEKLCAGMTDVLITINHEDYALAKRKLKAGAVEYVPGVGVDTARFAQMAVDRSAKRAELGIPEDAFLLASVGELNANKNHQVILRAMAELNLEDIHYIVAGEGLLKEDLLALARQLGVADRVHLLGFRNDVPQLLGAADLFCFPSIREGLGLAAVEAMAAGLPVVAAENRGTRETVAEAVNGFLCPAKDPAHFARSIRRLYEDPALRRTLGSENRNRAKLFDVWTVVEQMERLYSGVCAV